MRFYAAYRSLQSQLRAVVPGTCPGCPTIAAVVAVAMRRATVSLRTKPPRVCDTTQSPNAWNLVGASLG